MVIIGPIITLLIILFIIAAVTGQVFYVVKQQHCVIIERLGKFSSSVVLPSDFSQSTSMFEQMFVASETKKED